MVAPVLRCSIENSRKQEQHGAVVLDALTIQQRTRILRKHYPACFARKLRPIGPGFFVSKRDRMEMMTEME